MYETLKFTEMTTRRVIDAKDKDGEKVYVKGHAKATYMSDGRTVEDAIKQIGTGGGGGGGIAVEKDPVFLASPAASITEEQIEAWDKSLETYVADFTIESLKTGMNTNSQVNCDMQALVAAMNANKIILVREGEDSDYKGVHMLNGYVEDLLYFSIVDTLGNVLICEGTDYNNTYIDGQTLFYKSWNDKQDNLESGTNIKTINGESILGSGDIAIEGESLTESDIENMGFTKNTGTYSKPSSGIPKSDLESGVQTSLGKADKSLQVEQFGEMEIITLNGFGGRETGILYALPRETTGDEDDVLLSRGTVKTINGESIVGSGDIAISGGGSAAGSAQLPLNRDSLILSGQRLAIPSGKVKELTAQQTKGGTFFLSLTDKKDGEDNVWVIRFAISTNNSGTYQVEADEGYSIKWANGVAPTFENGKYYEMSFRLISTIFLGVWASFE